MVRFATIGSNFVVDWMLEAGAHCAGFEHAAVYSRTQERADEFAAKYGVKKTFTSLEALAADPEIDAVYVASPNLCHKDQAIAMMKAGKHVLCEKPMAWNEADFTEMMETARKNNVGLMEAMRPAHSPALTLIRSLMERCGTIRRATLSFCQYSSRYDKFRNGIVENAFDPTLANGALMDIGIYCIHLMELLFGMPKTLTGASTFLYTGVDGQGSLLAAYEDMLCEVQYAKITQQKNASQIQGEDGVLLLDGISITKSVTFIPRKGEPEVYPVEFPEGGDMVCELTDFIRQVEEAGTFLFLLRPRRFGKSLFANVLAAYYDVKMADRYDDIFRGLDIYDHPTKERGKYLVLKFNFSGVNPDPEKVEASFNSIVLHDICEYAVRYQEYLPAEAYDSISAIQHCGEALRAFCSLSRRAGNRIYLIIDEYDNFANTLLSYDEAGYKKLTHGTGFFRLFFNTLKELTTDNQSAIQRLFITGVTPLCLSDVTSGFNIGRNLSMDYDFNECVGFNEGEVRTMLAYYRDARGTFRHSIDEIVEYIKPFYNNSCFCEESLADDRMFNSDMLLYFLNNYVPRGHYPKNMIDPNVSSDMNKVRKMVSYDRKLGDKDKVIEQILNNGYIKSTVTAEFKLEDLGDRGSLVSLLYYLGLLSYGLDEKGRACLTITNQVVRQQYYIYLAKYYGRAMGWQADSFDMEQLAVPASEDGEILPLLEYICSQMNEQSSNRDFDREGESFVKGYIVATIGNNNNYFVCRTEQELNHGYCDILLTPKTGESHAFIIELKYLRHSATAAAVEQAYHDAIDQLQRYAMSHPFAEHCRVHGWRLHRIVLVVRGWELERLEEMS